MTDDEGGWTGEPPDDGAPAPGDDDYNRHDDPFDLPPAGVRPALDDPSGRPVTERAGDLFHRWTVADLLAADRTFHWRIRGMLVHPTYGMIGGEQKTLKSYLSLFIDLAVASGSKLFGQFPVDLPGPVVAYVGEGGRIPYTRRLERVAAAMGVALADVPLHPTFDIAPVASAIFDESLRRDLDELQPALVHVDPWYAYHGQTTEAKNLLAEGAHLSSLSAPVVDAGASLLVNHHFNQTGTSKGIGRLSMAGAQEWVDSWILLAHRQDPDVPNGKFWLRMEIGSRQWGGSIWELDMDIGRFDVDMGEYEGTICWDLRRGSATTSSATVAGQTDARARILAAIAAQPGELTKEEAAKAAGCNLKRARQMVTDLDGDAIAARLAPVQRSDGRATQQWRYWPIDLAPPLTNGHQDPLGDKF